MLLFQRRELNLVKCATGCLEAQSEWKFLHVFLLIWHTRALGQLENFSSHYDGSFDRSIASKCHTLGLDADGEKVQN